MNGNDDGDETNDMNDCCRQVTSRSYNTHTSKHKKNKKFKLFQI